MSLSRRVAHRYLYGYELEGEWEKFIGSALVEQTGIDDAEEEYFDKAKQNIADELEMSVSDLEDMDPGEITDDQYDDFVRGVLEAADEVGLIES